MCALKFIYKHIFQRCHFQWLAMVYYWISCVYLVSDDTAIHRQFISFHLWAMVLFCSPLLTGLIDWHRFGFPFIQHKTQIDCFLCIVFRLVFISIENVYGFYIGYFRTKEEKKSISMVFAVAKVFVFAWVLWVKMMTDEGAFFIKIFRLFFTSARLYLSLWRCQTIEWSLPFRYRLISYGFSIGFYHQNTECWSLSLLFISCCCFISICFSNESLLFAIPQVTIRVISLLLFGFYFPASLFLFYCSTFVLVFSISRWNPISKSFSCSLYCAFYNICFMTVPC